MNIEIANRLVALRKQNGLSQEELAAKLGISRQAVSKWERAEASPDTDNLLLLARLYRISLDELLLAGESNPPAPLQPAAKASPFAPPNFSEPPSYPEPPACPGEPMEPTDYGDTAPAGYTAAQPPEQVYSSSVSGREKRPFDLNMFPFPVLVAILYLLLGFLFHWWHPGWLIFLTIPLYYTLPTKDQSWMQFPYPILAALLFLVLGFFWDLWHPGWLVFLTVPLYYGLAAMLDRR